MFKVNDIVTPADHDKVLNDTRLSSRGKELIKSSGLKGVVTQVQHGLAYVSYYNAAGDDRITQVYKPEEIRLV